MSLTIEEIVKKYEDKLYPQSRSCWLKPNGEIENQLEEWHHVEYIYYDHPKYVDDLSKPMNLCDEELLKSFQTKTKYVRILNYKKNMNVQMIHYTPLTFSQRKTIKDLKIEGYVILLEKLE